MQDDKLKQLLSSTKMKADENLKFRIMQQIETEKSLSRNKMTESRSIIPNMLTIFGVMYLIIGLLAFGTYFAGGGKALNSATFYIPVILISVVCGMYWMITCFDERRHEKHHK